MKKNNIVFITGNENKRKEVEQILGSDKNCIVNISLDLPEIQSISVEEVTKEKIKSALELLKQNFNEVIKKFAEQGIKVKSLKDIILICEDSGLYINDMNKFPGALIKFYYESIGNEGIIKNNKGSSAKAETVIGIIKHGKIVDPIVGNRLGKIANKLVPGESFGWDPAFIPNIARTKFSQHNGKTYAELSKLGIKNNISHRASAFNKLKKML